jgi:hypothetical protein
MATFLEQDDPGSLLPTLQEAAAQARQQQQQPAEGPPSSSSSSSSSSEASSSTGTNPSASEQQSAAAAAADSDQPQQQQQQQEEEEEDSPSVQAVLALLRFQDEAAEAAQAAGDVAAEVLPLAMLKKAEVSGAALVDITTTETVSVTHGVCGCVGGASPGCVAGVSGWKGVYIVLQRRRQGVYKALMFMWRLVLLHMWYAGSPPPTPPTTNPAPSPTTTIIPPLFCPAAHQDTEQFWATLTRRLGSQRLAIKPRAGGGGLGVACLCRWVGDVYRKSVGAGRGR